MINRRTILWTLGATAGSAITGCRAASKPIESWDDRFGPGNEPDQSVSPRLLLMLRPGRRPYVRVGENGELIESGDGAAGAAQAQSEGESDGGVVVRIERVRGETSFPYRLYTPNDRIEHLGFDEDGAILAGAVEDLEHEALTRYDPPLPMLPAGIEPGEPMTSRADLTVLDRSNPDRQKDRGSCERTITYEADQSVITPAGRFDCLRIRSEYEADLTLATVTQTSVAWYAPRVGMVAERYREQVKAFIINTDKQWRMLLREKP